MTALQSYLSQQEMKGLGRLLGALRPARLATVRGAEVFEAGTHRGQTYTEADLSQMARNFALGKEQVTPPLVVGHEEQQPLDNTGWPAMGWVTRLYRRGSKLFADFGGIPRSIAKIINARGYRKVSAEVYDEPPEGAPAGCRGRMLRRVALLGGELPQIKTLADLPYAEYAEGQTPDRCTPWRLGSFASAGRNRVTFFAEAQETEPVAYAEQVSIREAQNAAMKLGSKRTEEILGPGGLSGASVEDLRKLIQEARKFADHDRGTEPMAVATFQEGLEEVAQAALASKWPDLPPEFIESLTPDQLGMLAPALGGAPAEEGLPPEESVPMQDVLGGPAAPGADAGMPGTPDRDTMIAELVELGQDPATLAAMSDEELATLYQEMKGAPMAETPAPTPKQSVGNRLPAQVTLKYSEVAAVVRQIVEREVRPFRKEVAETRALQQRRAKEERSHAVRAFCERMVKEGRLTPAQAEFGKDGKPLGPVACRLWRADAVRKFAEQGGKTDLELQMAEVEALPARRYGESIPDPLQGGQGLGLSPERRRELLSNYRTGRQILAAEASVNGRK